MSSFAIQQILKNNSIIKYLSDKGYESTNDSGGRVKFCCPIHKEDTPSFIVYTDSEYENFFCYGCKAGGNIINLKKIIEDKSYREIISGLLKKENINIDDEFEYLLRILKETQGASSYYDMEDLLFLISRSVYYFLNETNYQEPYFSKFDKFLQLVDDAFHKLDFDSVEELYNALPKIIEQEKEKYAKELKEKEKKGKEWLVK